MQAECSTLPAPTKVTQADEWIVLPLSSACLRVTDGSHFSPTPRAQGRPIVNVKDLKPGYVDIQSCTKIAEEDYQALVRNGCEIRKHDVLLSKDGTIGRVVVYKQEEPLVGLSSIAILRSSEAVDPFFLGQALLSSSVARQVHVLAGGSALRRLVLRDIKRICVSLPPLAEQRSIAAILDTVDNAIAKTEAVIAKLKQVRAGLLHDFLTCGLDENGQLRDPVAHPEQFQDSLLGFLPRKWDVLPLGTVGRRLGDGAHTSVETEPEGIPFLYVSCVRSGTILWQEAARISPSTYKDIMRGRDVGKGTVLYTAVGSYGFAAMVPDDREFAFQRHIAYITPDFARVDARFLAAFLNSPLTKAQADRVALGNAQKTVTLSMLRGLLIALPSRTEQQAIAQMLETHDAIIQREQELRDKLHKIKEGLGNDLLTGRVRVSERIAVAG